MLYFQPEISLLLAPPCQVHGEAGLGGELQATVNAPVVPGRPLLAGPLHVDPLLLLGRHLLAAVDAVPERLVHWQEVLKTGREEGEEREEREEKEDREKKKKERRGTRGRTGRERRRINQKMEMKWRMGRKMKKKKGRRIRRVREG